MGYNSKWLHYTSDPLSGFHRLRVDVSQTGFWEGREFHHIHEINLAGGATRVFRYTAPVDTIVHGIDLHLDAGGVRLTVRHDVTEGGTWTPVTTGIHGANQMTLGPLHRKYNGLAYERKVAVHTGGTVTGGIIDEILRLRTGDNANFSAAVGIGGTEHGFPPGAYYIVLENLGASTATGVVKVRWEERDEVNDG